MTIPPGPQQPQGPSPQGAYPQGQPPQPQRPRLACPLCGCQEFSEQTSRQDSRWGITSHVMTLLICRHCTYVLHFYQRNSYWDFD